MDAETKKFIEAENEKLARMIAKGFTATATKDDLAGGLAAVRGDLATLEEKMNKGFDGVHKSLNARHQEIDELRDRIKVLEVRMGKMEAIA